MLVVRAFFAPSVLGPIGPKRLKCIPPSVSHEIYNPLLDPGVVRLQRLPTSRIITAQPSLPRATDLRNDIKMHGLLPIFGLVAAALASKTLKYAVPIEMQQAVAASGCTLPGEFIITDYRMYDNVNNTALDVLSFNLDDNDTGIKTSCKRDASSQPSSAGSATATRWPCDNPVVEFITQDDLLTIVEKACPEQ